MRWQLLGQINNILRDMLASAVIGSITTPDTLLDVIIESSVQDNLPALSSHQNRCSDRQPCAVTAELAVKTIDLIVSSGLHSAGYQYFCLDGTAPAIPAMLIWMKCKHLGP